MKPFLKLQHSLSISFIMGSCLLTSCSPELSSLKNSSAGQTQTPTIDSYENYGDEYFPYQWHLYNFGQLGGTEGEDAAVFEAWNSYGVTGRGVEVVVVDDGIETSHPDLEEAMSTSNYNFIDGTTTLPIPNGEHGTCVSGVIGARNGNGGVKGVAPESVIRGYNFIDENVQATTENFDTAMTRDIENIDISNNSWGPAGGTGQFISKITTWDSIIEEGITHGRSGLGTIYLFAAGNDHPYDMASEDEALSYIGVLPVCSVNDRGEKSSYSERGANLWICAPSNDRYNNRPGITTTDITGKTFGYNGEYANDDLPNGDYTKNFGGTSSAAPLVSGVVALILETNPNLSWRDVKILLAQSARQNDSENPDWQTNEAGYHFHQSYGFGVVDAKKGVELASSWSSYLPSTLPNTYPSSDSGLSLTLKNDGSVISREIDLSSTATGISFIEYVQVTVDITHPNWGDFDIILKRNNQNLTYLTENHYCYDPYGDPARCDTISSTYTFGVSKFLGTSANAKWRLSIQDVLSGDEGTFNGWSITFYGH